MNWIYDTHIHLSDIAYEAYFPFILNSMKKINLKACCVSMDHTSAKTTLKALLKQFPVRKCFQKCV